MPARFYQRKDTRRKKLLLIIVIFISCLSVLSVYKYSTRATESQETAPKIYKNTDLKFQFTYPSAFFLRDLSEEDKKAGILFKAERIYPPTLLSFRYEDKLGMLKSIGGKDLLINLVESINARYPERFPEYKKEAYKELTVANERAAQIDFTYLGTDGQTRMKQRLLLVAKDSTACYLSVQAKDVDFDKLTSDFDTTVQSFDFLD